MARVRGIVLVVAGVAALAGAGTARAQREDAALRIAREITRRVARFENARGRHPLGTWIEDRRAAWSVRPAAECFAELRAQGVPHVPWRRVHDPVPAPVRITGSIEGVVFRKTVPGRPLLISKPTRLRPAVTT